MNDCEVCMDAANPKWLEEMNVCMCGHTRHGRIHPHGCRQCPCTTFVLTSLIAIDYQCADHVIGFHPLPEPHIWIANGYKFVCKGYTVTPEEISESIRTLTSIKERES